MHDQSMYQRGELVPVAVAAVVAVIGNSRPILHVS